MSDPFLPYKNEALDNNLEVIYNNIVKESFKIVKTYYINEAPDYNFEVIYDKIVKSLYKNEAPDNNFDVIYNKIVKKNFKIVKNSFKIVQIYCENEVRNFKHVSFCFIFVAF